MTRIREEEYGTQTEECMAMSVKFIRNYKKMCKKNVINDHYCKNIAKISY